MRKSMALEQRHKRVLQENCDIKLLLEFWPFGLKQAGGPRTNSSLSWKTNLFRYSFLEQMG
jgi:hypothetical protein